MVTMSRPTKVTHSTGDDDDGTTESASRTPLSAERIVLAALDLIEAQGLAQLSIRRLGEALGVQGMALYRHLAGKEAILDGVRRVLITDFAERMGRSAPFADWRAHLRAFGQVYREVGRTHPQAFPLLASGADSARVSGIEAAEEVLDTLHDAGFDPVTAMAAKRTIVRYVIGFSLVDAADEPALAEAAADPPEDGDRGGGAQSPDEALFADGLDLILDGLATRLPTTD